MTNPIKYNHRTELILPEYGRNIQRMVEIAVNIEDRAERNRCARTIIDSMGNLFPYLRDVDSYKHKLWDHLAVMSNFKLDIDYPYEIYKPEEMAIKPSKIPLEKSKIKTMHYGRFTEKFIATVSENETLLERNDTAMIIANHMKRSYIAWNKDSVEDEQIFNDLNRISKGKLYLNPNNKLEDKQQHFQQKNKNKNNNNRKHNKKG